MESLFVFLLFCSILLLVWAVTLGAFGIAALPVLVIGTLAAGVIVTNG